MFSAQIHLVLPHRTFSDVKYRSTTSPYTPHRLEVKRSRTSTTSSCGSDAVPVTPHKNTKPTLTPKPTPRKPSNWHAENKMALVEKIWAAGVASLKGSEVVKELGITSQQYTDATVKGRNNLRHKVIQAVAEMAPSGAPLKG